MRNFWNYPILVADYWRYIFAPIHKDQKEQGWWWKIPLCRFRGHARVVWYNPSGFEPDMHCVNCGDDLG